MDYEKLYDVAEVELWYKANRPPENSPRIQSSADAYKLFLRVWDDKTLDFSEEFKVIYLNRRGRVLGVASVSKGGYSSTVVDPKVVFAGALKAHASAIILGHNHPSGALSPSELDKELTKQLAKGGKFLNLPIQDHIIVTRNAYYSFADELLL